MAQPFTFISTCLILSYYIHESGAIITNRNKAQGNIQSTSHPPAHLISITEQPPKQNPTRRAESKVDASGESLLNAEQSVERQSLYPSSSHHYPGKWAIIFMLTTCQNFSYQYSKFMPLRCFDTPVFKHKYGTISLTKTAGEHVATM
jgi:hypothetical protein